MFHGGDLEVLQRVTYFPIGKKPIGIVISIVLCAMKFYLRKELIAPVTSSAHCQPEEAGRTFWAPDLSVSGSSSRFAISTD